MYQAANFSASTTRATTIDQKASRAIFCLATALACMDDMVDADCTIEP